MLKKHQIRGPMAKVSPDLRAALDDTAAEAKPLVVAYQLRGARGDLVPRADEMDALVAKVVLDATREAHTQPERQNVLRHVGSFIVKGDATLHRALVARPEVKAAILSHGDARGFRPPAERRGVARKEDWVPVK